MAQDQNATLQTGTRLERECHAKAMARGQAVFTVVAQDRSSPRVICEWIKENIETCPPEKLHGALALAIEMRGFPQRKNAD